MEQENLEFLRDNILPRLGLRDNDDLGKILKKRMEGGKDDFSIKIDSENKMSFTLNFAKGKDSERYFLNSIDASLAKEKGKPISHNFQLYMQRGFDVREMTNLMEGRSVYKVSTVRDSNERVGSWTYLDLSKKNESDNFPTRRIYDNSTDFRLTRALNGVPLSATMTQDDKEWMLNSLRKGNIIQNVTINNKGTKEKVTLEANPLFGKVTVKNSTGEELNFTKTKSLDFKVASEGPKRNLPKATKELIQKEENPEGAKQTLKV